MNLNTKRILVFFSIALNIGFVVMAMVLVFNHPKPFRPDQKMRMEILSHLDLPEALEKSVIASMEDMEKTHKTFKHDLFQVRDKGLALLAQPGPFDQKEFEKINEEIVQTVVRQNSAVREHLIKIRSALGDEKGARFFGEMLEQARKHHPQNQVEP